MDNHIIFKTEQEYSDARRKVDAYEKASLDYCRENKTNGIPAEVYTKFPFNKEVTNNLRSAVEHWEFMNNPPERYFVYINEKTHQATTWTGQPLGSVSYGKRYTSNMGDTRVTIKIYSLDNKHIYSGTFYKSSGDYARVKRIKETQQTF